MEKNDEISRTINIKLNGKKYSIRYRLNKDVLYFTDKDGGSIGFVKKGNNLSIFVDDNYSKKMWKKYPLTVGINAYTLAPKQMEIFFNWYFEGIYKLQ